MIVPSHVFALKLAAVASLLILGGCGGSSGSTSAAASNNNNNGGGSNGGGSTPAPTLTFAASPTTVNEGASVTVTWSSTNATSCQASGGWSGSKPTSGSEVVGPLQQSTTLSLSCSGAGGGTARNIEVTVDASGGTPDPVDVDLTASPEFVAPGSTATLSWTANNATSCTAGGAWTGARPVAGTEVVGPLAADATFQLTCEGDGVSAMTMVTVQVVDKILRWEPPTQNVDGTPLTDLAGYRVYWGQNSRDYDGNLTISDAMATEWDVDLDAGEYYFAVTAFDADDNESAYSNEVLKQIP